MMNAYFITFTTFGTRLHGDARGSVDRHNNQLGAPLLPADSELERERTALMKSRAYSLDARRRSVVLAAICHHVGIRSWLLYAAHVRTTHVHVVLASTAAPERVMNEFKGYSTRALQGGGADRTCREAVDTPRFHTVA